MIERNFNLHLTAGHSTALVINVNQFDQGEKWIFTLYNENGTQYIPSTGAIVGIKSDGLGIINSGSVVDGKVVIMETEQMTAAVGKAVFELMIDSQTHGTANFIVLVEPKPGNNADLSESDLSLLQEAIDATSPLPTGGTVGQVLTKTANGSAWSDAGTPTQEQVADAVSDWADEHITVETGVVIDTSLSVAGAAADSKKVGDELASIRISIENIDVEDQIAQYIDEHNIEGVTDEEVQAMVDTYLSGGTVEDAVNDWLDAHPEATTTVQDGSITEAKLAPNVVGKIENSGKIMPARWISQGYLRDAKHVFQGWTHCVRYDEKIGKAVGIVMGSATAHTQSLPLYRVTIDDDGYMSDYEEITFYDTDGETVYTLADGYLSAFCILSDGSYIVQCQRDITGLFKSTDKGLTFTRFTISGITRACQMFGMKQLSNGRVICLCNGIDNRPFAYSDDNCLTWTETAAIDITGLGRPPFEGDSKYEFGEANFIELSSGKLLAIARTSVGAKDQSGTVRAHKEGAAISYSEDWGETWTRPVWSATLTDMTACNASSCYANGVYHVALGSRYTYTTDPSGERRYFAMYYHWATEDNALSDNWSEAVAIDYGHWTSAGTDPTDGGYPSLWLDKSNNMHVVWYDGDGSGTANGANWRHAVGNVAVDYSAKNEGSGSQIVAYTQKQVERLLLAQKQSLMSFINDLYEKIGQLPPDSGDNDGSMYITGDLLYYFVSADKSTWDNGDTSYYIKAKYSDDGDAWLRLANTKSTSTTYLALRTDNYIAVETQTLLITKAQSETNVYTQPSWSNLGVDSSDGFTVEVFGYANGTWTQAIRWPNTSWGTVWGVPYVNNGAITLYNTGSSGVSAGYHHAVYVITPTSSKLYLDGAYVGEKELETGDYDTIRNASGSMFNNQNYLRQSLLRIYNKPLTAEEVRNNYIYNTNLIAQMQSEANA